MADIPREERTSIIPIPCHWSMGNATSRLKDGQGFPHKLELDVKLYALFDRLNWTISPSSMSRRGIWIRPS